MRTYLDKVSGTLLGTAVLGSRSRLLASERMSQWRGKRKKKKIPYRYRCVISFFRHAFFFLFCPRTPETKRAEGEQFLCAKGGRGEASRASKQAYTDSSGNFFFKKKEDVDLPAFLFYWEKGGGSGGEKFLVLDIFT